jgi:hypothetical protein
MRLMKMLTEHSPPHTSTRTRPRTPLTLVVRVFHPHHPTGIKLNAPGASTDAGCGIAGTLGLWEGIVSVCGTDTKWAKITGYAGSAIDTPSNPNLLL